MAKPSIYKEKGFKGRVDYLNHLANDLEIDKETVFETASILGRSEDFDTLVSTLEDHSYKQKTLFHKA